MPFLDKTWHNVEHVPEAAQTDNGLEFSLFHLPTIGDSQPVIDQRSTQGDT
jgi:hypothetical protein